MDICAAPVSYRFLKTAPSEVTPLQAAAISLDELMTIVGAVIRSLTGLLVVLMGMSEWARTRREAFKYLGWGFALLVVQQATLATSPYWTSPAAQRFSRLGTPVFVHLLEGLFLILLSHSMAVHERARSRELRRVTRRLFGLHILLSAVLQGVWVWQAAQNPGLSFATFWGATLLTAWELFLLALSTYLALALKPEIRVLPALWLLLVGKLATLSNLIYWDGGVVWLSMIGWGLGGTAAVLLLAAAHFGIVTETFTDPLTRLHNRRYFSNRITEEFDRALRRGAPISILVLDLDHFKRFNDTQGHVAGDTLLKGVARLLNRNLRPYDVLCRWGGEEFIAMLPDTSSEMAGRVAERLRQAMADVYGGPDKKPPVTISIGVAAWPDVQGDWRHVVEAADGALYQAKTWRNRVFIHVPPGS